MENITTDESLVIIQGSNTPITLTFQENIEDYQNMHVILCSSSGEHLKHWNFTDLEIDKNVVQCPLTQIDTFALPIGRIYLQIRALDAELTVRNYPVFEYSVIERNDDHILKPTKEGS